MLADGRMVARSSPTSIRERRIDKIAEQRAVVVALAGSLNEHDREQLLRRIDPEGGAREAAPKILPYRARNMRNSGLQPHGEAKAESIAGQQQIRRSGDGS